MNSLNRKVVWQFLKPNEFELSKILTAYKEKGKDGLLKTLQKLYPSISEFSLDEILTCIEFNQDIEIYYQVEEFLYSVVIYNELFHIWAKNIHDVEIKMIKLNIEYYEILGKVRVLDG